MSVRCVLIVTSAVVLMLVAGCGEAEPTATPMPPTATPMPPKATATAPPRDTPVPTATPTPYVPTLTSTQFPEPTGILYNVVQDVPYADGDSAQTLSLHLPESEHGTSPTLLVQGGQYMPDFVRYFASRGYAVISFSGRDESYRSEIRDTFCALAWAHANAEAYGFDAASIVAVGGSMWGGNAAILGSVNDPLPFLDECRHSLPETDWLRGVITLAGVFDYSKEADFFGGFIESISDFMGGAPDQAPEIWAEASAITWVDGNEPPFLVIHGMRDANVADRQSRSFAAALEEVGVDVELVLVRGANHRSIIRNRQAFEAMETFLQRLSSEATRPNAPGEFHDLTITILYDNTAYDARLQAEWGFAALIEYGGHTLLFDTGGDGPTLMGNMAQLGIDPQAVDAIVLSHIHDDHTNGLQSVLDTGITPTVYVPASFPASFKRNVRTHADPVEVADPVEIFPGLHSTGELGAPIVEQALVVETEPGIVVVTGCAHPGIVQIVQQAKAVVEDEVALVVGGFHLLDYNSGRVQQITADLRELDVRQVCPTHCTGEKAIAIFAAEYGDDYVRGGAGRVITIDGVASPASASDLGREVAFQLSEDAK